MRLSLDERHEIALTLQRHILLNEDPDRLTALEDSAVVEPDMIRGIYAFEWILGRIKRHPSTKIRENIAYSTGWTRARLQIDEQTRSRDRRVRMIAHLCLKDLTEEELQETVTAWKDNALGEFPPVDDEQLRMFLYEIFYELVYEFAGEYIDSQS